MKKFLLASQERESREVDKWVGHIYKRDKTCLEINSRKRILIRSCNLAS